MVKEFNHYTVMKNEVVDALNCANSDKIFVDCHLPHSRRKCPKVKGGENFAQQIR